MRNLILAMMMIMCITGSILEEAPHLAALAQSALAIQALFRVANKDSSYKRERARGTLSSKAYAAQTAFLYVARY